MKKKLLIVAGCMNTGGLENQLLHLAETLDSKVYEISFTSDQNDSSYKNTILSHDWKYLFLASTREVGILKFCRNLFQLLKKNHYDIVHSHELFHSGLVMLIAFLAGVPKRVAHSHSTQDNSTLHNSLIKNVYQKVMRLLINIFATDKIACSTQAACFLYGNRQLKKGKIDIIWNSVDTASFLPYELGSHEGKIVVHVGRFVKLKNQNLIIRVASEIKKRNEGIHFWLVGDGPTYEEEHSFAEGLDVLDYVTFLGNRNNVAEILKNADAFVLPSVFEGMPLSLIEAQASGLPCVISDTITEEVDFGISLIDRIGLDEPISRWADQIIKAVNKKRADIDSIKKAISQKGFDTMDYGRKVEEVYLRKKL